MKLTKAKLFGLFDELIDAEIDSLEARSMRRKCDWLTVTQIESIGKFIPPIRQAMATYRPDAAYERSGHLEMLTAFAALQRAIYGLLDGKAVPNC